MTDMIGILAELESYGLDGEILAIVGIVALAVALIVGIFGLVLYILQSAGLYAIAKRRNIGNAWLAWIPVGYYWVAGSLSDDFKLQMKNKTTYNRVILPILAAVSGLIALVAGGVSLGTVAEIAECVVDGDLESLVYAGTLATGSSGLLSLLADGLDIALLVFWQIALYNIYYAANPKYAVAFTVLGILFPVTIPFFLFFNRKKDRGMETMGRTEAPAGYLPEEVPDDL